MLTEKGNTGKYPIPESEKNPELPYGCMILFYTYRAYTRKERTIISAILEYQNISLKQVYDLAA